MLMSSVLIVEDHVIFAKVLKRFLLERGKINVKAVAPTSEKAHQLLQNLVVDLVLVDIALPAMSGIELVRLLKEEHPNLPCMMVSGYTSKHLVQRSLKAGARGYVSKDDARGILEGIDRVLNGEIFLGEGLREI